MVGNGDDNVLAARAVGMPVFIVNRGEARLATHATVMIPDLYSILGLLKQRR